MKGSIIRTGIKSSFGFDPLGTNFGSKSAGIYLLRTLRSPMVQLFLYACNSCEFFLFRQMEGVANRFRMSWGNMQDVAVEVQTVIQ